jgi:outer membrane murein-binding lipoprotein Lpp
MQPVLDAQRSVSEEAVKAIVQTGIAQVAKMQGDLETARKTLDATNKELATAVGRADQVKKASLQLHNTQLELTAALKDITDNRAFFSDPKNIARLREFVTIISKNENTKILADLATDVRRLSAKSELEQLIEKERKLLLELKTPDLSTFDLLKGAERPSDAWNQFDRGQDALERLEREPAAKKLRRFRDGPALLPEAAG